MGRRRSSWEPSVVAFDRWTVAAVAIASMPAAIIVGLVLCALLGALLQDGCVAFMGGCGVTR